MSKNVMYMNPMQTDYDRNKTKGSKTNHVHIPRDMHVL